MGFIKPPIILSVVVFSAAGGAEQRKEFLIIKIQVMESSKNDLVVKRHLTIHKANEFFGHLSSPFHKKYEKRTLRTCVRSALCIVNNIHNKSVLKVNNFPDIFREFFKYCQGLRYQSIFLQIQRFRR